MKLVPVKNEIWEKLFIIKMAENKKRVEEVIEDLLELRKKYNNTTALTVLFFVCVLLFSHSVNAIAVYQEPVVKITGYKYNNLLNTYQIQTNKGNITMQLVINNNMNLKLIPYIRQNLSNGFIYGFNPNFAIPQDFNANVKITIKFPTKPFNRECFLVRNESVEEPAPKNESHYKFCDLTFIWNGFDLPFDDWYEKIKDKKTVKKINNRTYLLEFNLTDKDDLDPAVYGSGMINVTGSGNTCETIANDLRNPKVFSWNSATRKCWLMANMNVTGELILENVTFHFNITTNNQYKMYANGTLRISNQTNLTNNGSSTGIARYTIRSDDDNILNIENSTISFCGYGTAIEGRRGLEIYGNNTRIINVTFDTPRIAVTYYSSVQSGLFENNTIVSWRLNNTVYGVYASGGDNLIIRNNLMKQGGSLASYGILMESSKNNIIDRNNISTFTTDQILISSETGIVGSSSSNTLIINNFINGLHGYSGINVGGGATNNVTIRNNTVLNINLSSNGKDNFGIKVWGDGNYILENNVKQIGGDGTNQEGHGITCIPDISGISPTNTLNLLIENNTATYNGATTGTSDNGFGISTLTEAGSTYCQNITIRNNVASNNGRSSSAHDGYGLYIVGCKNCTIKNNTANSNTDAGIYVGSSALYSTFTSNTANSNGYGIFLISGKNNTFINNSMGSNSISGDSVGSGIYIFGSGSDNNYFSLNNYSSNEAEIRIEGGTNNLFEKENFISSSGNYIDFMEKANNNIVKDIEQTGITAGHDVYEEACEYGGNNTILNVSYQTLKICDNNPWWKTIPRLTVQWYVTTYVNDTLGNPLENANITLYNNTLLQEWNYNTSVNGYVYKQNVTQLVTDNTTTYYYSNYTANASYLAQPNQTYIFNLTGNIQINFTFLSSIIPVSDENLRLYFEKNNWFNDIPFLRDFLEAIGLIKKGVFAYV